MVDFVADVVAVEFAPCMFLVVVLDREEARLAAAVEQKRQCHLKHLQDHSLVHHSYFGVVSVGARQGECSGSVAEDRDSLEAGHQLHGAVILGAVAKIVLAIRADEAEYHEFLAGVIAVAVAKAVVAAAAAVVVATTTDADVAAVIVFVAAPAPLVSNMLR